MERTRRILERLPLFYRVWDENSIVYNLIFALGKRLDEADKEITAILRSHWVDTAFGHDLDRMGAVYGFERKQREGDTEYKNRLKQAVIEFKGGGTINSILTSVRMSLGLPRDHPIEMIENPELEVQREFEVTPGDIWTHSSESVVDATPTIEVSIASESEKITNPTIKNLETGESVTYLGTVLRGQKLVLGEDSAQLDGKGVKRSVSTAQFPRLLRKQHKWFYEEPISEEIGVYDTAVFDESKFAIGITTVRLTFKWVARQPATFEIKIPQRLITREDDVSLVDDAIGSIKATGVRAVINVVKE